MSSIYPPAGGTQSVPCQRCHAPLLPNDATCRNCGYYNAPAQGNNPAMQGPTSVNGSWSGGTSQPSYGQNQSQSGPPSWGQFPVSSPTPPPQGQNTFNNPSPTPSPQGQNAFNNPSSSAGQPASQNFFGAPVIPSSPMEGNGYVPNQYAPSVFPMTPAPVVPQRPSGLLSTGPVGPQVSTGPISQAPYGMPPTAPQRPSGLLSTGSVGPQAFVPPSTGPVSQVPYGMPSTGFQQFGAPSIQGQQFPGTAPFDASRTQAAGPQSFSPGMSTPASAPDLPRFVQPTAQETLPARRMKPWMIVLTVLLVIVVVGGAFVGYVLINKQSKATVTPTTVATGSAKGAVLFTDTFKNNANGWSLQADPGIFSSSLANGFLVLEDNSNELLWQPLPKGKTFSDFTLSADAMLSQGDQTNGYGFYIRGTLGRNSEMATYYRFELYGDGSYAVFKGTEDANGNATVAKLVNYTLSSAIHKRGIINHITITAKGSSISLIVNGQMVKTIADTSYISGSLAAFVSNMQNAKAGAQAKFANLTISAA